MATEFASSSPLLKKSRVRVSSTISLQRLWIQLLFFFLFEISKATSISSYDSRISYSDHCKETVPESTPNDVDLAPTGFLQLQNGYYTGGDKILGQNTSGFSSNFPRALSFRTISVYKTDTKGVLKIEGSLGFRGANMFSFLGNSSYGRSLHRQFHPRAPRFPVRRGGVKFRLQGFWSESSGKLCMVGSGSSYSSEGNLLDLSVVFKLNYPNSSNIFTSLVNGRLESLDKVDQSNYFEPVSILAFYQRNYEYTFFPKENENGCSGGDDGVDNLSLGLEPGRSICSLLFRSANGFKLEYGSDCDADAKNCSPLGRSIGYLPGFISFDKIQCSEKRKLRLLLGFSNTSYNGYNQPFAPNTTLVAEGAWDEKKNRLCVVACRFLNISESLGNASVGDCSIKLSLRFPAILSIRNRSSILGQVWSNKTMNDLGYFDRIVFRSSENRRPGLKGLKYKYTKTDGVKNSCAKMKPVKSKGARYPDVFSYDMRFDMSVKNADRKIAWGYSYPLSVGDQFYESYLMPVANTVDYAVQESASTSSMLNVSYNVSYTISFSLPSDFKLGGGSITTNMFSTVEIFAEGIYDDGTGGLCMVGCRDLGSNHQKSTKNDSMDCEILVDVQFPPLNAKSGGYVKGTIKSTRETTDSLYFKPLELSSSAIYTGQAKESIWRMDLEITMVLISNTLACVFVGLQLFYVKKNPDVLPFISLVMLVVLTLGHMIPLVLNFEALFVADRNRQNVLLGSGGWLEVNEVIVRVVTMVAFLLQFRLLQLTWSARLGGGSQKGLWVAEKKALYVCLPLYLGGGLIAWFLHSKNNYYDGPFLNARLMHYQQHSLWGDLRSYAGLVLDGFLLPQVLFNLFWNSRDKALASSFYVGTTAVRLLPHAYDLYRAHSHSRNFGVSYIYANPGADFYSTGWDVIIPCGGLLFAALIYLQQRFGGHCILPQRFRGSAAYEKVPVVSGE
ncbi:hypothetical protein HHK36_023651 [Tetracentron sinense]|uniref:RING-type E3 ubiquitin transferase n=1 Tax=Tetracentron sinense TaxID=13715 RepID=A0A834YN24_TETSI|nr:hypothetical protein HHK36_023651 [Tetracentron sinense]